MNEDTSHPPGNTLSLRELCERVRLRLVEEYQKDLLFNPFPDPPMDCYAASVFVLIGGFVPPEDDPETPSFTGVVVFSFDEAVTGEQLHTLAQSCLTVKRGTDVGELADLKQMLLTGDNEFVRASFRWPVSIAGNEQTYAAPILFVREFDLVDGYLSTDIQLIFVHPERPDHPCPVPPKFWAAAQSLELLSSATEVRHGVRR